MVTKFYNWEERFNYVPNEPCPECCKVGSIHKWNDFTAFTTGDQFAPLYVCDNEQCKKGGSRFLKERLYEEME